MINVKLLILIIRIVFIRTIHNWKGKIKRTMNKMKTNCNSVLNIESWIPLFQTIQNIDTFSSSFQQIYTSFESNYRSFHLTWFKIMHKRIKNERLMNPRCSPSTLVLLLTDKRTDRLSNSSFIYILRYSAYSRQTDKSTRFIPKCSNAGQYCCQIGMDPEYLYMLVY